MVEITTDPVLHADVLELNESVSHLPVAVDKLRRSTRARKPPARYLRRIVRVYCVDQGSHRDNTNHMMYLSTRLTSEMESATFGCKYCGIVKSSKTALHAHVRRCHRSTNDHGMTCALEKGGIALTNVASTRFNTDCQPEGPNQGIGSYSSAVLAELDSVITQMMIGHCINDGKTNERSTDGVSQVEQTDYGNIKLYGCLQWRRVKGRVCPHY